MTRFLFGDLLWRAIERRAKAARRTKAAIAYVTRIHPLAFRAGDLLVVDATDGAIACGRTSAAVLSKLHRKGVQIYNHKGLHAKCIILDSVLFTSSANLSTSSIDALLEAGIETDSPNSVSEAAGMVERLRKSSTAIDSAFIKRIKRIKVDPHFGGERSIARTVSTRYRPALTWLLGVHDIEEPTDPVEINRINKGTGKQSSVSPTRRVGPHGYECRTQQRSGARLGRVTI
jgi:phosphatidylserine/phosphatidylglycerophosphate/cardiolipin synthase-like enzyme